MQVPYRLILSAMVACVTIVWVLYIAIIWGVIDPIMTVANAIDTDTLTAQLVSWEFVKFFFREALAAVVAICGFTVTTAIVVGK